MADFFCRFSFRPFPVLLRAHALHPCEELGEGSLVGEVEVVGQLGDGAVSGFQSQRGLGSKRLVEEINHGATAHLTDNAREVGGGDAEQLGIELKVAVADKVIGNKTQECGKDLFCTGCEAVAVDGKILCLQQFDAEQGTEREDGLLLIGRRMEDVATEVGEQRCQAICLIAVEGQFRLPQFGCGEIDGTDYVAQGCTTDIAS